MLKSTPVWKSIPQPVLRCWPIWAMSSSSVVDHLARNILSPWTITVISLSIIIIKVLTLAIFYLYSLSDNISSFFRSGINTSAYLRSLEVKFSLFHSVACFCPASLPISTLSRPTNRGRQASALFRRLLERRRLPGRKKKRRVEIQGHNLTAHLTMLLIIRLIMWERQDLLIIWERQGLPTFYKDRRGAEAQILWGPAFQDQNKIRREQTRVLSLIGLEWFVTVSYVKRTRKNWGKTEQEKRMNVRKLW